MTKPKRSTRGMTLILGLPAELKTNFKILCLRQRVSMLKGICRLIRRALADPTLLEDPDGHPGVSE